MLWPEQTMSGGHPRPPPLETEAANAASAWLQRTIGGQTGTITQPILRQYDATAASDMSRGTTRTTTTRHFAAWEQTTTHFSPPPQQPSQTAASSASSPSIGQHSHPALLASVNLKASPVIRPIASRLTSPGPKELLGPPTLKPPVKLGEWIFACLNFSSSSEYSAIFANYLEILRERMGKKIRVSAYELTGRIIMSIIEFFELWRNLQFFC